MSLLVKVTRYVLGLGSEVPLLSQALESYGTKGFKGKGSRSGKEKEKKLGSQGESWRERMRDRDRRGRGDGKLVKW